MLIIHTCSELPLFYGKSVNDVRRRPPFIVSTPKRHFQHYQLVHFEQGDARLWQSEPAESFEHAEVTLIWGGHQSRVQPWSALITAASMKHVNSLSGCCFALSCWAIVCVWWAIMINLCRRRGLLSLPVASYAAHLCPSRIFYKQLFISFVFGAACCLKPNKSVVKI